MAADDRCGWDVGKYGCVRSPVITAARRDWALAIGADPRGTADERFRKRLLVGVELSILPAGLVWGYLY